VRQDIFRLPKTGRVGQGYNVRELADAIRKVLGLDRKTALVIVGCGRMGMALAQHVPFSEHGMCLAGLFDNNPSIVGREVKSAGLKIMGSATLGEFIKERNISIAALCVPTSVAQDVTDGLNATGIKGILNFTRKRLKVPPEVEILHAQFICSFIQLAYKCGTG
jgi:redox-sensing transcriptional repressor